MKQQNKNKNYKYNSQWQYVILRKPEVNQLLDRLCQIQSMMFEKILWEDQGWTDSTLFYSGSDLASKFRGGYFSNIWQSSLIMGSLL